MPTILIVEDDAPIRRGLCDALKFHGHTVRDAADGRAGLDAALATDIDLVILDILMPRVDGLTVLRELRQIKPALPIIMLTAKGEELDRVRGLRDGADDYVVKPFSLPELIARVDAVLRRSAERSGPVKRIAIAGRTIDFLRREITLPDGARVVLSEQESKLLAYLAANRGRAIARDELLSRVWGLDPRGVHTRTVDMAVARVREALRDDPTDPSVIVTVRIKGYMLAEDRPSPTPTSGSSSQAFEGDSGVSSPTREGTP